MAKSAARDQANVNTDNDDPFDLHEQMQLQRAIQQLADSGLTIEEITNKVSTLRMSGTESNEREDDDQANVNTDDQADGDDPSDLHEMMVIEAEFRIVNAVDWLLSDGKLAIDEINQNFEHWDYEIVKSEYAKNREYANQLYRQRLRAAVLATEEE